LFGDGAASSVKQGSLGDCWLIGVFACLAQFPGHVEALFEEAIIQPSGRYCIRLFDPTLGSWRNVVIDDIVPCHPRGIARLSLPFCGMDVPCFSQPRGGEVWPLLLEKAFAKVAGSYGALEGGIPELAFQHVTGQKEQIRWQREEGSDSWLQLRFKAPGWHGHNVTGGRYSTKGKKLPSDEMFRRMAYYDQANFLMAASIHTPGHTLEHRRLDGLVEGHAYSVLEVQEVHGTRLIRLRNPWGKTSWRGEWSSASDSWNKYPEVAVDIWRGNVDDGSFWMSFGAFALTFHAVIVCPSTMPVPKVCSYQHSHAVSMPWRNRLLCGRCGMQVQSLWTLVVVPSGRHRSLSWVRFQDGDLCPLCLRMTAPARRQGQTVDAVGRNGVELQRLVPGVDYFPFEAGAGCILPGERQPCRLGQACTSQDPRHYAQFDHPWMRPGPEVVQGRKSSRMKLVPSDVASDS